MSAAGGESFRSRSLSERIASALPASGGFVRVRRWLKPMFATWLAPAGGGLRSLLPNGEEVVVSPAFRHMTWNRLEYDAFRAAVRPGDIIVDAGANVGAYTILFAKWAGAEGRVFAFEPDPGAYDGLQSHVRLNNVAQSVTLERSAIADGTKPRLRFEVGNSSGVSRMVPDAGSTNGLRDVEATSIDRYCAARGIVPRVIKIDVEGAELQVLEGARRTIAAAGADLQLFVEMHPRIWPELGITADDVRAECLEQGLVAEALDDSADDVWQIEGVCLRLRPARP